MAAKGQPVAKRLLEDAYSTLRAVLITVDPGRKPEITIQNLETWELEGLVTALNREIERRYEEEAK